MSLETIFIIYAGYILLQHFIFGFIYSRLLEALGMDEKKEWAWLPILNLAVFYQIVKTDITSKQTKNIMIAISILMVVLPVVPWLFIAQDQLLIGLLLGAFNSIVLQVFFLGYGLYRYNKLLSERINGY